MGCGKSKNAMLMDNVEGKEVILDRKIILVGDSGVGKSAIIHSYLLNSFVKDSIAPTVGVKNQFKVVDVPGGGKNGKPAKIRLDIWDTAGEAAQQAITQNFYQGSYAVIICYAIDMPSTFKSVSNYVERVEKLCSPSPIIVIVGNKCDLDNNRKVKKVDLDDKAEEHNVDLKFETSAMQEYKGTIDAMFTAVIDKIA